MRHIVAPELGQVGLEYIQADFDRWLYGRESPGGDDSLFCNYSGAPCLYLFIYSWPV